MSVLSIETLAPRALTTISQQNESQVGIKVVPPLGATIKHKAGKYQVALKKFMLSEEDKKLPKQWNNFTPDKDDTKDMLKNKMLSTKPPNQGLCGSCYAVSTSSVISDNFLFGMNLSENPLISPMFILSCLPQTESNNKCGGGGPSIVIDYIIEKGGITSNDCMNYESICRSNEKCYGNGIDHLKGSYNPVEVNPMVPNCKNVPSCCKDSKNQTSTKVYQLKNKIVSYDIPMIKKHLMKYGAAIGGFNVFNNFIKDLNHGKFLETNGIYIKSVNYSGNKEDCDKQVGGHAVAIVGWGIDTITFKDKDGIEYKNKNIEYWLCRNSWTSNWGNEGYFKYSMYQEFTDVPSINKDVAMETTNKDDEGGILLVEPDYIKDVNSNITICNSENINDNNDNGNDNGNDNSNNNNRNKKLKKLLYSPYLWIGIAIIIFMIIRNKNQST